jgi:hypothetical protein
LFIKQHADNRLADGMSAAAAREIITQAVKTLFPGGTS